MGWNILLLACVVVLILFMDSISDAASTNLLLTALVACPVVAALPALLYNRRHPRMWYLCATIFSWLTAGFFYYLICVWMVIMKATPGQSIPPWVQIWLPGAL